MSQVADIGSAPSFIHKTQAKEHASDNEGQGVSQDIGDPEIRFDLNTRLNPHV
jgi:hypothetical protein